MDEPDSERVYFREVQRFRQAWLWATVLASDVIVIGLLVYRAIQRFGADELPKDAELSNTAFVIIAGIAILLMVGMTWLFVAMRLVTEVRGEGLYVRFYPLWSRLIPYGEIQSCEAREYRPIREYGGWGIRWGPSGKAYNVSGHEGVQLTLKSDKPLLIGSQMPEQLAGAVNERREKETGA